MMDEYQEANKENVARGGDDEKSPFQMNPPPQPSSQRSAEKEPRDCPQTPLGRLPLSQLLANGDDSRQNHSYTPVERVLWENSPMGPDRTNSMPKRKRKRAHSASPASSSQNEASAHFAGSKAAKEIEAFQQALKTPKTDLAEDLWSRYSMHATHDRSPSAPGPLPFPHLMNSSSPQTPASHVQRDGSLRRALSCIEWPTSKAKRRKTFHNGSQQTRGAILADPEVSPDTTKMSRVSLLVEKMHSGMLRPRTTPGYSSSETAKSSSPAQRDESPAKDPSSSPNSNQAVGDVATVLSQAVMNDETPVPGKLYKTKNQQAAVPKTKDEVSDFDDDEIDLELLETTNAEDKDAMTPVAAGPRNQVNYRSTNHDPMKQEDKYAETHHVSHTLHPIGHETKVGALKSQVAAEMISELDEFDEDDADVFAADLEDVFARYDTKPLKYESKCEEHMHSQKDPTEQTSRSERSPRKPAVQPKVEVLSSDEEDFGDDSDFEQLAAECAQATQEQANGMSSQPTVGWFLNLSLYSKLTNEV